MVVVIFILLVFQIQLFLLASSFSMGVEKAKYNNDSFSPYIRQPEQVSVSIGANSK